MLHSDTIVQAGATEAMEGTAYEGTAYEPWTTVGNVWLVVLETEVCFILEDRDRAGTWTGGIGRIKTTGCGGGVKTTALVVGNGGGSGSGSGGGGGVKTTALAGACISGP